MDTVLIAASIAAAAAVVAAIVSWIAAHQSRRSSDRTHAWERITWAAATRPGSPEHDISRSVLRRLNRLRWAPKDDRKLALSLIARRATRVTEARPQEGDDPC